MTITGEKGNRKEVLTVVEKLTFEQYTNSAYPLRECKNFGYEHLMQKELKRWEKYNPEIYVCQADPKLNYGLDFKVYLRYTIDEGLTFFNAISYGFSSMTNAPFRIADSFMFLNFDNAKQGATLEGLAEILKVPKEDINKIFIDLDKGFPRDNETRKKLAKTSWTLTM